MRFFSTEIPFDWPAALAFVRDGNSLWYDDLGGGGEVQSRRVRQYQYTERTREYLGHWEDAARSFATSQDGCGPWLSSAEGLCGLSAEVNALHMSLLKLAGVKKVFFVCRQQASWAPSLWRQFLLAEDRFARFVPFETLFGSDEHDGVMDLDWNGYVRAMDAEFGSDNVLVLPYELLVADSTSFFKRLNTFLGLAEDALIPDPEACENPSRKDATYRGLVIDGIFPFDRLPRLRRNLHRLAVRFPLLMPGFIREDHSMSLSNVDLELFQQRFTAANEQLEARLAIDLKDYGY